ncbi:MAG TPA: acetyl-CoA carboxylase biotin carboxyl carrier protein [candidate division Zixibacteria bacterium]|nr:acetyl-CoA carboxylase biotin carboxyl carrier protein [candidate division Zixibacteria bacterium]
MNEKMIRKLIKLVEDSRIDQLEVSSWGRKVRITRRINANNGHFDQAMAVQAVAAPSPAPAAPIPEAPVSKVDSAAVDADKKYVEVKSPMVGTFYAAPAPDAQPYVTLNQRIEVGQVVCIVEAMKLMNEIESEVAGRVAKVMVDNAQPVEFGQVLFLIDPEG